ncbi:MAG: hypothetical protein AB1631_11785 [Acidobacteriota bacterium]
MESLRVESQSERDQSQKVEPRWARRYGPAATLYLLATLFTTPLFLGDTPDYVASVLTGAEFWEFGHLTWRPAGWLLFRLFEPVARWIVGPDKTAQVSLILIAINWVAGLSCVLLLRGLLSRFINREWAADAATVAFIFSQGFLSYTQTGCSYIPGLAFLLLGLFILARNADREDRALRTALFAGLAFAASLSTWFLYLWAMPAAFALPLAFGRRRWKLVLQTAIAAGLFTAIAYAAVLAHLGIYNLVDLKAWIASSSHGMKIGGASRVVFGLPRSIISLGNDGLLFKRFLLDDPLNPVSLLDLFRLSLWKLGLFYLFALSVVAGLFRSAQGRRLLALLALNAIPALGFAVFFDGGAMERYFPLYSTFFISLAFVLSSDARWLKAVAFAFIAVAVLTNIAFLASPVTDRHQETVAARIVDLQPLKPASRVFTVNQQDELLNFHRSFPFNAANQQGGLNVRPVVAIGTEQIDRWREEFAAQTLAAWQSDGDVWVSNRLLAVRPRSAWYWVEGDDLRVSWKDLNEFFSQFDFERQAGGEDGFSLLAQSEKNEQRLKNSHR